MRRGPGALPSVKALRGRALPLLAALAVSLPFLLDVEADPDLWWHVVTGEMILERGGLPAADPFSFTAAGAEWTNHEWGSDVVLAAVYRLAGDRGLVLLRALLFTGAMALLARLAWERFRHPLGLVALLLAAVEVVSGFLNLRPHTFTYLFTLALLAAAEGHRRGNRWALAWWPPLMVLWVNLHGGFLLGLAVTAFAAAALLLRREAGRADRRRVLVAGGLTALAPLANPYGPKLFLYLQRELGADHSMVLEWVGVVWFRDAFPIFLVYTVLPLVGLLLARRGQRPEQVALFGLAVAATWVHGRFLVVLVLAGTLVLAASLGALWPRLTAGGRRRLVDGLGRPLWGMAAALAIAAVGGVHLGGRLAEDRLRLPIDTTHYPVLAVEYLKAHDLGPDLALRLDWGGYAIWHLWPDYRVSVDGRNLTVYDAAEIDAQLRAYHRGELAELFADTGVDAFLIENGGPALEGLRPDERWVQVYGDPLAAVLVPPAVAAELPARRRVPADPEPRPEWNYFP